MIHFWSYFTHSNSWLWGRRVVSESMSRRHRLSSGVFISAVVEVLRWILRHKNINPKYDRGVVLGATEGACPGVNERLHSSSLNYASPTGHACYAVVLFLFAKERQANWFAGKPVLLKTHWLECLTCATRSPFVMSSIQSVLQADNTKLKRRNEIEACKQSGEHHDPK